MFERFTDRARRVLVLAQEEASLASHGYVGTEHLLLGLIREQKGVAAQALSSLGIGLDATRAKVEEMPGTVRGLPGPPPFSPRAKQAMKLSLREALDLGQNYIGTEHLLLGIIRQGDGSALEVLVSLDAALPRVHAAVTQLLSERTQPDETPTGRRTGPAAGWLYAKGLKAQRRGLPRTTCLVLGMAAGAAGRELVRRGYQRWPLTVRVERGAGASREWRRRRRHRAPLRSSPR